MNNTHINTGTRKILEIPHFYNLFGLITGGKKRRENHAKKYFSLKPGEKVLDIGCGSGALLNYLEEGVEYHGFDMQQSYINFAKQKFGTKGYFYCEPVGKTLNPDWENYFDAVNADGILHHLSEKDCNAVLSSAQYYLKNGGSLVTIDPVMHNDQSKLEKWIVSQDRGQNVRTPKGYNSLVKPFFSEMETEIISGYLIFPYSSYIMNLTK